MRVGKIAMKRWILRILVCLLLGAVTTVAVAWGCAQFISPYGVVNATDPEWTEIHYFGIGAHEWHYLQQGQTEPGGRVIAGWPCLALAGYAAPPLGSSWTVRSDFPKPFAPIWPGFVIDTLFYAAIWGGLFFGFASAKRGIRRARGRCPECGYDLRGNLSAGCSECGWKRS
jgi:hypothetical protein